MNAIHNPYTCPVCSRVDAPAVTRSGPVEDWRAGVVLVLFLIAVVAVVFVLAAAR